MTIDKEKYYVVSGNELLRIQSIEKRLYSEQKMTGDEMRDMANYLNQVFFSRIEGPVDISKL